jgi:hypothetical protein
MTEKNECGIRNAETAECLNFIFSAFQLPNFTVPGTKKNLLLIQNKLNHYYRK